jgi:hypothetical protein
MKRYSKKGLWTLFLICAFPIHVWTIILAFRDFSWVSERTNAWDAVGVISYGLLFALIESVVVFLTAGLLGFLVSKKWEESQRVALLSTLVLITSLWAMASYLFFLMRVSIPGGMILFVAGLKHPLRFLYAVSTAFAGISVVLPTYLILRSDKFLQGIKSLSERLSLLTMFYLFFDFVGVIIVIVRNLKY